MRTATALRQESEDLSEPFSEGRYKYSVTDLRSSPLGVGFKTTIFNESDSAVEFGIVDSEDREVAGPSMCGPGEKVVLEVSDLRNLSCYIRFRPI